MLRIVAITSNTVKSETKIRVLKTPIAIKQRVILDQLVAISAESTTIMVSVAVVGRRLAQKMMKAVTVVIDEILTLRTLMTLLNNLEVARDHHLRLPVKIRKEPSIVFTTKNMNVKKNSLK